MIQVDSIINSIFNSKTYFIHPSNTKDIYIIDCGDAQKIIHYILKRQFILQGIFLTHTHFDHIYGLNDVLQVFPECEIYTSAYGAIALFDDKLNFSYYHECPLNYKGKLPRVLKEGDSIVLYPDCILQVIETLGHCPSCLTYIIDNYIFTGDSYIPGIKVVTNLPKGNKILARQSQERIIKLAVNRKILPGHDM